MTADHHTAINRILSALAPERAHVTLSGLDGSAPAYVLSRLLTDLPGPLLILTPDDDSMAEICRELRFFSGREEGILAFPAWDTSPYDQASPHPDCAGERLSTLFRLMNGRAEAVVAPMAAILQRVLPRQVLGDVSLYLVAGEEVERERLLKALVALGYSPVPLVEDRGTFALRGGIVDIFPPNQPLPLRVEFFGDQVESIRVFDPVSQRSLQQLSELVILPSREVVLNDATLKEFAISLKRHCDDSGIPASRRRELLEQVQNSICPQGLEYLQPLLHPGLETLFSYAGPSTLVVLLDPDGLQSAAERWLGEVAAGEVHAQARDLIFSPATELYLTLAELQTLAGTGRRISIPILNLADREPADAMFNIVCATNDDLRLDLSGDSDGVLRPLVGRLNEWLQSGQRVAIACHQQSQAQRLMEILGHYPLSLSCHDGDFPSLLERRDRVVSLLLGEISRGFRLADHGLVVVAEEEIFGKRLKRRGISEIRKKQILVSLAELKPGDYMVHLDFGVGIYRGLQHLTFDRQEGDFLLLEYAGADRLYLPVDRICLVQRYVGAEGLEPTLDRLGGPGWEKKRAKALAAVQEMADELLKIYAAREVHEGYQFSPPDDLYREFEGAFAFEETPDQQSAIDDVLADMARSRPMDRLICGDVGYGKTEVAMRGAFKAVMDGKQVAVLVPTTVLAQQHLETFRARFAAYPVTVEMVSRFRTPTEQRSILEGVRQGRVDVVIGTHRLLQKDVTFKDLGLVIIDEEHRFGVVHKERLKSYRALVDVMTLTATPIPRTLHMSLSGIRDLSIIDTPPVDRLTIKTFVARFNDETIREAIMRELRRGGQVFFVHNRVQSIAAMADYLRQLVPEARLAIGHGQMEEKELERVMLSFMHAECNLLLSTTIIESGLDIPTANTIIVNRADTFGLAQLYQLRGRVGRSKQRAFAYFLIPGEGAITSDARQRLKVIQELTELGAGFRIATHDLEIRGAGDLLGGRQSGNIAAVGFELYTELLEEAVARLKGEERRERVEPEISLQIPAFIPEGYVADQNQRLVLYKRLTQASSDDDINEVMDELCDRFGPLPQSAIYLFQVMRLRIRLKELLVKVLEYDGRKLVCAFHEKTPVAPETIIQLIRSEPQTYQFTPDFRLLADVSDSSFEGVLDASRNLLKRLG